MDQFYFHQRMDSSKKLISPLIKHLILTHMICHGEVLMTETYRNLKELSQLPTYASCSELFLSLNARAAQQSLNNIIYV